MTEQVPVSLGRRLGEFAAAVPDRLAIILKRHQAADETLSYRALDRRSNQAARLLAAHGVGKTSRVALALPNCLDYFVATYAIWKCGACVFPIRDDLPAWERERLFAVAQPTHVIGSFDDEGLPQILPAEFATLARFSADELPDVVPHPYKMNATGGSTGLPRIVVQLEPGLAGAGYAQAKINLSRLSDAAIHLIPGPFYHYGPARNALSALGVGHTIIVLEKFDPVVVMESIQSHRVQFTQFVPTMLYRILQLPDVARYDVSSVTRIPLGGAHCPDWLFEKAMQVFGTDIMAVSYGATEGIGVATATGREWLTHRGTCGRGALTDIRIQDAAGNILPPGEIGEIWMHPHVGFVSEYLGEPMRKTADHFATLGDLGWMDEDAYLYIADRRKDLIVSGGANVYPAEVEAVLLQHPKVEDSAVIGLPDAEWGARVHAIVVLAEGAELDAEELKAFCRARLAAYKVPKSFARIDALPRDGMGKLRRSALAATPDPWGDFVLPLDLPGER